MDFHFRKGDMGPGLWLPHRKLCLMNAFSFAPPAPPAADLSMFGDGSDGDHEVAGDEVIGSGVIKKYRDLTVPVGTTLRSHKDNKATVVYVSRTLTLVGDILSGYETTPSGAGDGGNGAGGIAPQGVIVFAKVILGTGRVSAAGRAGVRGADGTADEGTGVDVNSGGYTLGRLINVVTRSEDGWPGFFAVGGAGGGTVIPGTNIQGVNPTLFAELANLMEMHPRNLMMAGPDANTEDILNRFHWIGLNGRMGGLGAHNSGGGGGGGEGGRYWFGAGEEGLGGGGHDGRQHGVTPKGGGGGGGGGCGSLAILYTISCAPGITVTAAGGAGGAGGDGKDSAGDPLDKAGGGGGGGGGQGGFAALYAQAGCESTVTAAAGALGAGGKGQTDGTLDPTADGTPGKLGPAGRSMFLAIS